MEGLVEEEHDPRALNVELRRMSAMIVVCSACGRDMEVTRRAQIVDVKLSEVDGINQR